MRRNSFVPACLYLLLTKHVTAYEGRNECKDGNVINAISGQNLKLTTDIEPLTRCYVVFTDNEGGDQCCFNENDSDCNASDKYKQRNNSKCLEEKTEIVTLGTIMISYVLVLLLGVVLWRCGHIARKDCCCTYRRCTQASAEADGFTFVEK